MCVCVYTFAHPQHVCIGSRTTRGRLFSHFTMWMMAGKLTLSGLVVRALAITWVEVKLALNI